LSLVARPDALLRLAAASIISLVSSEALAQEAPADAPPPPKPPPYSLPFALRPVVPGTVIRSDTAFMFYKPDAASEGGTAVATTLLASYKVTPELAPLLRLALVNNSPPEPAKGKTLFANPAVGAIYGIKPTPETRLGLFLGLTVPIGGGGGNEPEPEDGPTLQAGAAARSAMDNALFATNYFTVFPGVGFAYVAGGFTAQVEATIFQLTRVKGDQVKNPAGVTLNDSSRTNFTTGVHVGYFFIPQLSLGAELRHQRWLSTPTPVKANPDARDTTTVAVGPRVHIKLSDTAWFRPALVYARPLDKPLTDKQDVNIVQLDLPFVF
jgi:hypothetical protein